MRKSLLLVAVATALFLSGCSVTGHRVPGHDPAGPGNSENAPGHDPAGPGNSENAPGHNKGHVPPGQRKK